MKVIFLDIDGVLNSLAWLKAGGKFGCGCGKKEKPTRERIGWDPELVCNLRKVVEFTDASIVISSAWRGYGRSARRVWRDMFACYGWRNAPVVGETPDLSVTSTGIYVARKRGDEVAAWLKQHPEVTRYVCIDDEADFLESQPLVRTSMETGFTIGDATRCVVLLAGSAPS